MRCLQVIALAGKIGSGKSSLASKIATATGWPRASYGEYVRYVARAKRIPQHRDALQELGQALIDTLGWLDFTRNVLQYAGWDTKSNAVVDGIRHQPALGALRVLFGSAPFVVYIDAPSEARKVRVRDRDDATEDQLRRWEGHSTESHHAVLREQADVVINGASSVEDALRKVIAGARLP